MGDLGRRRRMTSTGSATLETQHEDMIHDAQLDYFGKRLATCSSDRSIKIFQVEGEGQTASHRLLTVLTGHEGPVWQVCWAHPKFGSMLASCSYDHKVIIWQEGQQGWQAVYNTNDSPEDKRHKSSVNSIAWAPHDFGLALVAGSSDGSISIVQYVEQQGWKIVKKDRAHDIGCNTVSWAPYVPAGATFGGGTTPQVPPARIASGGCDNKVRVWQVAPDGQQDVLQELKVLQAPEGHTDWVRDVAWAPSIGLSHNILATGSQDHTVILWQEELDGATPSYKQLDKVQFPACVWRCSWSVNGSILAVSCGDNKVYLLKQNADGSKWEIVSSVDESS